MAIVFDAYHNWFAKLTDGVMSHGVEQLTIRTLLGAILEEGSFERAVECLAGRFKIHRDVQDVGYFYRSFLKRNPETVELARRPFRGLKDELIAFTLSDEFKQYFGLLVLDEFPELHRDLFVHVPKTAGTSVYIAAEYDPRFVVVRSPNADIADIGDWKQYCYEISQQLFDLQKTHVFIKLHLTLSDIERFRLRRPEEQVYTIVREPMALMISYVNFALTRVASFVGEQNPPRDVVDMRRAMGYCANKSLMSCINDTAIIGLIDNYIPMNPMCSCLGATDAEGAFENIWRYGVQIYRFDQMPMFFSGRNWKELNENVSDKFIEINWLSERLRHGLVAACQEDLRLFDRLNMEGIIEQGSVQTDHPRFICHRDSLAVAPEAVTQLVRRSEVKRPIMRYG
jgi:hypothetical protein